MLPPLASCQFQIGLLGWVAEDGGYNHWPLTRPNTTPPRSAAASADADDREKEHRSGGNSLAVHQLPQSLHSPVLYPKALLLVKYFLCSGSPSCGNLLPQYNDSPPDRCVGRRESDLSAWGYRRARRLTHPGTHGSKFREATLEAIRQGVGFDPHVHQSSLRSRLRHSVQVRLLA